MLAASVEARRASANLSYYAFTATPRPRRWSCSGDREPGRATVEDE